MHRGIKWPRDAGRGRTGRTLNSHSDKHSLVHKHKLVSTRAHTHTLSHTHTHTHVTEGNSPTTRNARHARHIYKGTGGRCFPVGSHPPPSDSQSAIRWHSLAPVSAHMSTATFLNSSTRKTVRITSGRIRAMVPHKPKRTSTFPHHLCDGERPIVLPKHLEKRARRLEERRRRSALSAPHGLAPHCIQVLRARETLQEGAAEARHQDPPAPTWCAHILRRGACGPKVLAPLSPGAARPTALFRCPAQAYC